MNIDLKSVTDNFQLQTKNERSDKTSNLSPFLMNIFDNKDIDHYNATSTSHVDNSNALYFFKKSKTVMAMKNNLKPREIASNIFNRTSNLSEIQDTSQAPLWTDTFNCNCTDN